MENSGLPCGVIVYSTPSHEATLGIMELNVIHLTEY
jgi:hypothetical protein